MVNAQVESTKEPRESGARSLMRLHFELALEVGVSGKRPLQATLRSAVEEAGCDIVMELPTRDGKGTLNVIRMQDDGRDGFLQVVTEESGFQISDEADIEAGLLELARASLKVLEKL
jgi:hypothetical protein